MRLIETTSRTRDNSRLLPITTEMVQAGRYRGIPDDIRTYDDSSRDRVSEMGIQAGARVDGEGAAHLYCD